MSSNAGHHSHGSPPDELLVSGSTFDGEPYQVALETTEVARGASGKIFRGKMLGTLPWVVAVKVIPGLLDPVLDALLARELRAARAVSVLHPYILPFLGTANVGGRTAIVSVFMDNGNLKQYIKSQPTCDKKKLILQVADAVGFLHGTMGLVHGDIKCENVLISYLGDALLADFGLSTFSEKLQTATPTMTAIRQMNTLQFAAPELLLGDGTTTPSKTRESDVYAFGMLVLEALSDKLPWPNQSNLSIMHKVCSGQHPPRPTLDDVPLVSISHSWWQACQSCWRFNPHERARIIDVLSTLKATEPGPHWELPIDNDVYFAEYMRDGETIVAACRRSIILFNTTSGHIRDLQEARSTGLINHLAVSPDGRHIAYAVEETIRVVDSASDVLVSSLEHDAPVECVAYSRDGTRIASGSGMSPTTVRLWDAATGAGIGHILEAHTGRINSVSFSPDGICLASGSRDGTIRLWDSTTCTLMATLEHPDICYSVPSMEFSPVGMHIIAGCSGCFWVLWDVRTGRTLHFFETHPRDVNHVSFSPSEKYVAASLEGGCIEIWDVQDGEAQVVAPPHPDEVMSVAFSPNGKNVISTTLEGKVWVYDLFD